MEDLPALLTEKKFTEACQALDGYTNKEIEEMSAQSSLHLRKMIIEGAIPVIEYLVNRGVKINHNGRVLLTWTRDPEMIDFLVKEAKFVICSTLLPYRIKRMELPLITQLVSLGADLTVVENKQYLLTEIITRLCGRNSTGPNTLAIADCLIRYGAPYDQWLYGNFRQDGSSPEHFVRTSLKVGSFYPIIYFINQGMPLGFVPRDLLAELSSKILPAQRSSKFVTTSSVLSYLRSRELMGDKILPTLLLVQKAKKKIEAELEKRRAEPAPVVAPGQ